MERIKQLQTFTGGMNTVITPRLMPNDKCHYILNCDITSTDEGNLGMIRNVKGNTAIQIELPAGENKTIGTVKNEESKKMYFAVWNSEGRHTWYEFDYVSLTTKVVLQSMTDTRGEDIFQWEKGKIINSANIVDDKMLYWTMDGHPARKFNIEKAIEKSFDNGYGNVILEEYTRAYKRAPAFAPSVEYFTNPDRKKNSLYRRLFKFAVRFIYDDNEYSTFSDFSKVAVPEEESVTGTLGVPLENNGIHVRFPTGGMIVKKIELIMQSTTDLPDVNSDWVSIMVFDKAVLGIGNNTEYEYEFYNDNTYLAIDQPSVLQQQSDLPDNPKVQEMTYNTLVYGNFYDGFPVVKVDFTADVEYTDLFVPDGTANVPNSPSLIAVKTGDFWESGGFLSGGGWRHTFASVTVGPDVKSGNVFQLLFTNDDFGRTLRATLNDTAFSIASKFRSAISDHPRAYEVSGVTVDGSGSATFTFKVWNNWNKPYIEFITTAIPVNYSTLKDTGNSVPNEKLGSSYRYAIRYENEDGKRSLAFGNNQVVVIDTINDLGVIKKVATILSINHLAPSWATRYSIVRTKNLSQMDYIQLLIQRINTASTLDGEEYHDLIIGSLFTYQKVHPNTTLSYEFKKGDRVRLVKTYSGGNWSVPSSVVDYEVLNYYSEYRYAINENITADGTSTVKTNNPDPNNVGNNIVIGGIEREIIGTTVDGYTLDSNITLDNSTSAVTRPSYEVINRNGILRIKIDPDFPINVNPSNNQFAVVEVYTPSQTFSNAEQENYYDIGYKFEIVQIDGQFFHRGNDQDQTPTQEAKVRVEGFDNYVRNRQLITNTSERNPQSLVTSIEDRAYSDFYQSRISSLGRPTRLDDSRGVVHYEDRLIWSNNFIEDTRINGLNMFLSTNRVDYNDKYGSVQAILFYEGKLYVFKYLKTGWVPVLGNLIIDSEGTQLVGTSTKLLPDKMEYFLWEGGVGDNPESIVKSGNEIFGVSPNSQILFVIGGAGVIPVSKIYGIDNYARDFISSASASGAKMFGGINRKKNQYILMVEPYEKISYTDRFNISNTEIVNILVQGEFNVVSPPSSGILTIQGDNAVYFPNPNFSGIDSFSYRSGNGIVRNVVINVLSSDVQFEWRASGQYCVVEEGERTGYKAWSLLEEFDNISSSFTGRTKPNVPEDPDYISPVEDLDICPIGFDYSRLLILRRLNGAQTLTVSITSEDQFNIVVRKGEAYSGDTIWESGLTDSGSFSIPLSQDIQNCALYIEIPSINYAGVTSFSCSNGYIISGNFNDLSGLKSLLLDQSANVNEFGGYFSSLQINLCSELEILRVIGHSIGSFDLTPNGILEEINVSSGLILTSLTISSWAVLRILRVYNVRFTIPSANPSVINGIITDFNNATTDGSGKILQYGINNTSGIKPSASVREAYGLLITKGASVIGVPPTDPTTNIVIDTYFFSGKVYTEVQLTSPIYVPINVSYTATVYRGGNQTSHGINMDFEAGEMSKLWEIQTTSSVDSTRNTNISISPNPAAGTQIQVINQNP